MFFNKTITVERKSNGQYTDDGVWQDGATQEIHILANVQPLNANESAQYTQVLTGGNRTVLMVKIYTTEQLQLDTQMTGQVADVVQYLGKRYKVAMQESWQSGIISHNRYIGVEVIADEFDNQSVSAQSDC